EDGGGVVVKMPLAYVGRPVELLAALEEIDVGPVHRARVVISERTQTIVAGGDVHLMSSVVVHDGLTIMVKDPHKRQADATNPANELAPKPEPRRARKHAANPLAQTKQAEERPPRVHLVHEAATLGDVAAALGTLGLSSRELASVLEAMRT